MTTNGFPTFSILTPVNVHSQEREAQLYRAIDSVKNQTYSIGGSQEGLWEHIIIDDGSTTAWQLPDYPWLRKFEQPHLERLIALNYGFKEATKDWFVFLDSDDMLSPYYLEAVSQMIAQYPDYKVFNFGSVHFHPNYQVHARDPFMPPMLEKGHEFFAGGRIVNGTFVFHRECYEKLGGFPEQTNPWDFSTEAQKEFPEISPFFVVDTEDGGKVVRELGNPMGQDFYMFYKLTREYHSKPFRSFLYLVFHKGEHKLVE